MGLDILYLLIPASLVLALAALAMFVWAIHTGQFDDLETPAIRILFDDQPAPVSSASPADAAPAGAAGSLPEQSTPTRVKE